MEEMMLNWFQYNPWVVWPTAALLVVVCLQIWFYVRFLGGISRESKRQLSKTPSESAIMPGVSVIVCANDQAAALSTNLPLLLNQEYPEFQVVVVNNASTDNTEDVLQRFESYPNFYHTFVPPGVRNVSFRKMAMTIGIKAATHDYVLFVDPMGIPAGNRWLASMMGQVDNEAGVVLGYASNRHKQDFWHRMVAYDTLFSAMKYLGLALKGLPYRAHPSNLAFRKDLFFSQKGFSSHLFLQSGADDLLIREMATPKNIRVELSRESFIQLDKNASWTAWKNELLNHFTTSGLYKPGVRFLLKLEGLTRLLFYVLTLFLLVLTLANGYYVWLSVSAVLLLTRFIVQGSVLNKTAKQLNESTTAFLYPIFDIVLPLVKAYIKLFNRSGKGNAYTWEVLR